MGRKKSENRFLKLFQLSKKKKIQSDNDPSADFIFYVSISFFALALLALVGIFNDPAFLISLAVSGFFFTLYDMSSKKSKSYLSAGILFAIAAPQYLKAPFIESGIRNAISSINSLHFLSDHGMQIGQASLGNTLTICSVGLVLFGLAQKNKKIQGQTEQIEQLNEDIKQQENWNAKFEEISQLDDVQERILTITNIIESKSINNKQMLAKAYVLRGFSYYKSNQINKALQDYDKAIQLDPEYAVAYNGRANLFKFSDQIDKALQDYDKAIQLNPEYATPYNNRANLFSNLGYTDKAILDYDKAIQLNLEDPTAYYNRAILFKKLGQTDRALQDYDKAIQLNPEDAEVYYNRAILFKKLGQTDKALQDYDKAIQLNPKFVEVYYNRAILFKDLGQTDKALQDHDKAIQLNPEYAKAYNNRANLFKDLGQTDKALQDYDKAIQLNPEYAKAYYNRAILFNDLGQTDKAAQDYQKAAELNTKYANQE